MPTGIDQISDLYISGLDICCQCARVSHAYLLQHAAS